MFKVIDRSNGLVFWTIKITSDVDLIETKNINESNLFELNTTDLVFIILEILKEYTE